jgi:hypothetical protein
MHFPIFTGKKIAMTRTAKRGPENKKRYDATEWSTLKPHSSSPAEPEHEVCIDQQWKCNVNLLFG